MQSPAIERFAFPGVLPKLEARGSIGRSACNPNTQISCGTGCIDPTTSYCVNGMQRRFGTGQSHKFHKNEFCVRLDGEREFCIAGTRE
jgi:hypothetical protein